MDIAALVGLASNTLVSSMVTDAWEATRHRIACLFSRGEGNRPDAAAERRLETARSQLMCAAPGDVDQVRTELAAQWRVRLADLLEEHPEAAEELAEIVEEIGVPGRERGSVRNVIYDGTYHGPVIMGGDISGISFPPLPPGSNK